MLNSPVQTEYIYMVIIQAPLGLLVGGFWGILVGEVTWVGSGGR